LELKLKLQENLKTVQHQIQIILGDDFRVQNQFEQQEATFKMIQLEKWISFLVLAFILAIALFNVVSSLSMLMIEKQEDVRMLRSMGADDRLIRRIFMYEGSMIPAFGALIGILIGVVLCLIQWKFGIIQMGNTAGAFISDNYPVRVNPVDLLIIFLTVFGIGMLVSWYPVRYLGRKWLNKGRLAVLLFPFLFCTCQNPQSGKPSIVVTIEPQRYFAEMIAGDHFDVYTVVPVGQSPETYDPAPREMIRIAQSIAYLQIGQIGFEQTWMQTIRSNNPHLKFFDVSEGVDWIGEEEIKEFNVQGSRFKEEEESEHHHHGGIDPHIWSATTTAKIIATNTLQAFLELDPEHNTTYQDNYQRLIDEIDATAIQLHSMLDTLTCRTFVIYHPALTYFANEFGLRQLSIEADGKEPSVASIRALIDEARKMQVRVVFVQQEFDRKHAEQIATEINARVVIINPLAKEWQEQMIFLASELIKWKN
jgi:zinc transport system substrate-binding protein